MSNEKLIQNPILCGFYPDPSICRVDNNFYLVTSSFSYFPGVPIFHSTDLIHWEQIGHVLDRNSQLPLDPNMVSGGIFAPTIRYHDGVFYMITTNINGGGNFIVTATVPAGPWSEPYWIEGAEGIDPSLFFDDDGKAYYTGTGMGFAANNPIWISEIDLKKMKLVGEKRKIWTGALIGAAAPEAPHLYKKDDYYYLMIAEGGTEHYHAVTIARSKNLQDSFVGCPGNPIMTHRHLGEDYPICNTGHADLVQLEDGSWYMVLLASRLYGGYHKNLGRETFLMPVNWNNDWPVVSPGTGKVEWTYPAPNLPKMNTDEKKNPNPSINKDNFDSKELAMCWNFLGTPYEDYYRLADGKLILKCLPKRMVPREKSGIEFKNKNWVVNQKPDGCLSFVGRRQQHQNFEVMVNMNFTPREQNSSKAFEEEAAGLIMLQNNFFQFRLECFSDKGTKYVRVVKNITETEVNYKTEGIKYIYHEEELARVQVNSDNLMLAIHAKGQKHSFYCGEMQDSLEAVITDVSGDFLGSETAGGFVGTYIAMFATANGSDSQNQAAFEYFEYIGR